MPASWALLAYPSLRPLSSWIGNLAQRAAQLAEWTSDFAVPKSVWLPGESPVLPLACMHACWWQLNACLTGAASHVGCDYEVPEEHAPASSPRRGLCNGVGFEGY